MKLKKYLLEFSEIAEDWFNETQWLENNFQFYKSFFQEKKIEKYEWSDFQKLGDFIHAFNTNALAKKRALGNPNLSIERYREIFKYIITTNDEINVVINNLLDTEKYKLPYFGDSAISELIGYLYADKYVFYNSRDEWAIREIGIDFSKKRAEKFGDKFIRYNQSITNVIEQYIEIVGQKTNTSVCLEVDQFFSWIYTTKQKGSSINKMIDSYKEIIKESKLEGEIYKWKLVKENNGVSNLATENFVEEINKLKFGNLAYQMALPVLKKISEDSPEKLKEIFIYLFDESIDIDNRVESYIKSCKKIYKGENQTHQDTRTAATLLTFLNPNNYTFYKSTTYEKYCKLINVKKEKREKRYSHYLNLLKDLSDNYISKDKELLNMKESFLGKDLCNYDKNNMILAQDILNEVLVKSNEENQNKECDYWIFQGNPKVFNVVRYINESFSHNWSVGSHKDKIKIGDKVILWVTGKNAGCYALAEITSELYQGTDLPEEVSYYTDFAKDKYDFDNTFGKTKGDKINIRITHNISENPITTDIIANNGDLAKLKVGHQGTNFSSNESEYNTILNMIENNSTKRYWIYSPGEDASEWEEFKSKSYIGLGWDGLGDLSQYKTKDLLHKSMQKSTGKSNPFNDTLANWEFSKLLKKGDIVFVKKGRNELLGYGEVISEYRFDDNKDSYKHIVEVDWKRTGSWSSGHKMVLKTFTDITEYPTEDIRFEYYFQRLFHIINNEKIMKKPINKILFGPPGTGKTYKLSHEYFDKYTIRNFSSEFEDEVNNRKENFRFQMLGTEIGTILHFKDHPEITCEVISDKEIKYDNEVTSLSNSALQVRSELGYTSKSVAGPKYWCINGISLSKMRKELESYEVQESSQHLMKRNYAFVTFHQAFSYEDFIEGIKPVMNEETDELKYEIKDGVFKQICDTAKNDPENKYALFIDEINRGNVANIFGELITLIEPDKREGMDNELSVKLPYSKTIFSVPNNLDIIGTMNTADRSVEALDTALRRRFEFEEMLPNSSLLSNIRCEDIKLDRMLNTINGRIEKLLDKDHQIGHSYFMNSSSELSIEDLQGIFKNKIMPLLQEYFYGDFGKIGLVLGNSFIKENKEKIDFSKFPYDDRDLIDERKVYQLSDIENLEATDFKSIYEKSE